MKTISVKKSFDSPAQNTINPDMGDIKNIINSYVNFSKKLIGDNLVQIYFFGSRAIGNFSPSSDIDLLIETYNPISEETRDTLTDIAIDVAAVNGILLDVHYYTKNEMSSFPYNISPFIVNVIETGIKLCR